MDKSNYSELCTDFNKIHSCVFSLKMGYILDNSSMRHISEKISPQSQGYTRFIIFLHLPILFIKDLLKIPVRGLAPLFPESVTVLHKVK